MRNCKYLDVGDGDEHLELLAGSVTWRGLLNSSVFLNDQFSFITKVRSS